MSSVIHVSPVLLASPTAVPALLTTVCVSAADRTLLTACRSGWVDKLEQGLRWGGNPNKVDVRLPCPLPLLCGSAPVLIPFWLRALTGSLWSGPLGTATLTSCRSSWTRGASPPLPVLLLVQASVLLRFLIPPSPTV